MMNGVCILKALQNLVDVLLKVGTLSQDYGIWVLFSV